MNIIIFTEFRCCLRREINVFLKVMLLRNLKKPFSLLVNQDDGMFYIRTLSNSCNEVFFFFIWRPWTIFAKKAYKQRRVKIKNNTEILQNGNATLRSSRPEVFCKNGVLRNFAKFTGKYLYQSLFLNKVAGLRKFLRTHFLRPPTLLKKRSFPVNFVEFLRTPFFIEQLWWQLLWTQ